MRLRSFTAPTMADAMRLVRDELGPEAVILATEESDDGYSISAAIEEGDADFAAASADERDALETIAAALDGHGVPLALAQALGSAALDSIGEDAVAALASALASRFRFSPIRLKTTDRMLLIGPPGAGKTVTAAKLAARQVLMRRSVRVISADTARAGGVEQLAALMRVLDLPFAAAEGAAALARASAGGNGPLIIDSPGFNPYRQAERDDIRALAEAAKAEPVLVLAAGMDLEETTETAACCAELGCRRLIATRLDMSRRLGSVLAAAEAGHYAFAEVGIAPDIADGLWPLTPLGLARLLLPGDGMHRSTNVAAPFDRGAYP
ncbi:MAG TPA: AAA family ATPase [Stellaceae bacterium]|nr:AAA family ATPase [Stellaceae bacterium]